MFLDGLMFVLIKVKFGVVRLKFLMVVVRFKLVVVIVLRNEGL